MRRQGRVHPKITTQCISYTKEDEGEVPKYDNQEGWIHENKADTNQSQRRSSQHGNQPIIATA